MDKKKKVTVRLSIDEELFRKLSDLGKSDNRSIPNQIRWILHQHLEKCEKGTFQSNMAQEIDESIMSVIYKLTKFRENLRYVESTDDGDKGFLKELKIKEF